MWNRFLLLNCEIDDALILVQCVYVSISSCICISSCWFVNSCWSQINSCWFVSSCWNVYMYMLLIYTHKWKKNIKLSKKGKKGNSVILQEFKIQLLRTKLNLELDSNSTANQTGHGIVFHTTRNIAFNDTRTMTHMNLWRAKVRVIKKMSYFVKSEVFMTRNFVCHCLMLYEKTRSMVFYLCVI